MGNDNFIFNCDVFAWPLHKFFVFLNTPLNENMMKSNGCQSKSPFPRIAHDMCHFVVLIYNLKFCFLSISFNIVF